MDQIYYLFLGSLLTLLGSFLSYRFQSNLLQIEEDKKVLFEISELLLDFSALKGRDWMEDDRTFEEKLENAKKDKEAVNSLAEEMNLLYKLNRLPLRIGSKRYQALAVRTAKFALDGIFRTKKNLYNLTDDMHKALNKTMVDGYRKDIAALEVKLRDCFESQKEINRDHLNKLRKM